MNIRILNKVLDGYGIVPNAEDLYVTVHFLEKIEKERSRHRKPDPSLLNILQIFQTSTKRKMLESQQNYAHRLDGIQCYHYAMAEGCLKYLAGQIHLDPEDRHKDPVNIDHRSNYYEGPRQIRIGSFLSIYLFILAFARKEGNHPRYRTHGLEQGLTHGEALEQCIGTGGLYPDGSPAKFFFTVNGSGPICQHNWLDEAINRHDDATLTIIQATFRTAYEFYSKMPAELVQNANDFSLLCYTLFRQELKEFVRYRNRVAHDGTLASNSQSPSDTLIDCVKADILLKTALTNLITQNKKIRKPGKLKTYLLRGYSHFYLYTKGYDFLFWATILFSFLLLLLAYKSRT